SKLAESRGAITGFKPEFPTLKLISCQMIMTPHGERYVHQTTMWILQRLKTYSWDAKALVTLAAFALEYGNLLYLTDTSTADQLVNSLKQLNQIQNRKVTVPATDLVVLIMEVFNHIRDWATWSGVGYDTLEVPSLSDALQDIHVAVYWIIASIVAATGNINGVSDYKLSDFKGKLSSVDSKLKEHLKLSKGQIDSVEQNLKRKKAISNPKDIVDILKILLQRDGDNLLIYDGSTKSKTNIEVFKGKYVLLFISSLNKVEDEILLLNYIYDRLKDNPQEMKGYKKEDFKILWIPIFEGDQKIKFDSLKNKIKFYAVEYFSELPGIGLIREIFNYWDKPVVPVLSPLGDIINDDAMNLIFQWGIDAFPFRKKDGDELDQKWKWFWDVTKRLNLGIQVKGDRYIFIYGGGDKKWIQDFTMALEKTKRHEAILRADAIIEHYHIGKDDPKIVPRFWIEIESKTLKKHQDALDCKIQDIVKSLLCLKQDPQGWVILTKGYNVKLLGHGEPMYQTLADFDIWKDKVLQKEGFDIAFKEHYETKIKETYVKQPCAIINVDNNINGNVIATISCPNPTCGREMEVSSVNYKCCHRDHATQNGKI
ncbi:sieve element-occluding protein, partial [Trifolium pratense]